jgi:hypothetical protein
MASRHSIWLPFITILIFTVRAEEPTNPELAKVDALIAQLGSDESKLRDAADLALRKIGLDALPKMKAARAETRDAEVRNRLDTLLKLFAPERKARTRDEIFHADSNELTRTLYQENVNENARLAETASGGAPQAPEIFNTRKFLGVSFPSNQDAILSEFTELLGFKTAITLATISEMEKNFDDRHDNIHTPPVRFLGAAVRFSPFRKQRLAQEALGKELADLLKPIDALSQREQPPSAEEWKTMRESLKKVRDLVAFKSGTLKSCAMSLNRDKMSCVFQDALVLDVIHNIAIQSNVRVFFDPVELGNELAEKKFSGRYEDVSCQEILQKLIEPLNLSYRIEGEGESQRVVIQRIAAPDPVKK